jgi:hypothetical protein
MLHCRRRFHELLERSDSHKRLHFFPREGEIFVFLYIKLLVV